MSFETINPPAGPVCDAAPNTKVPFLGAFLRTYVGALAILSGGCGRVFSACFVTSAEMNLLSFPEELWRDKGLPCNSMQRWIEHD